jgi:hypothetical protein
MHPDAFIADLRGFEQDLERWPELLEAHAELIEALAQLEAEVRVLVDLNRKHIK